MKKVFAFTLAAFVIFAGGVAFAQELGNPAKLIEKGEIDVGFEGVLYTKQSFSDYRLNRTYSNRAPDTSKVGADFENDAFYMATITYGVLDRLNVFARLGLADGGDWLDYQPGNNWKGKLESNFVWALGAKFDALKLDNGFGVVMGAQYLRYDDRKVKDWSSQETGQSAGQLGWNTNDTIDYWQADFVLSTHWTIGAFTPYVGAGYSWSKVSYKGEWTHQDPRFGWIKYDSSFENSNKFSGLVGFDVALGDHFKVNVQGTFISRTAVGLGLSYCF
jgi:hypothetical protein